MSTRRTRILHKRRRGITLLEVVIAIALMIALLSAMFSFFWNLLNARDRLIADAARNRSADLLIDHLERDLVTAIVGDAALGSGVMGDGQSIRILSRQVPARLAGSRATAARALADLEQSTYRFNAQAKAIEVGRDAPDGTPSTGTDPMVALEGKIFRVRIRYHDGAGWVDSFDALAEDRLPRAVEIAVWFDRWPGEEDDEEDDANFEDDRRTRNFDERALAMSSDLDSQAEPMPDRLRVIAIPDAQPEDKSTSQQVNKSTVQLDSGGAG